jgi:hypothetical protein
MSLCEYSNIFGEPNKGVHSARIGKFAVVDLILTGLAAFALNKFKFDISLVAIFIILIIIAIVLHKIFCVKTALNSMLFRDDSPAQPQNRRF